MSPSNPDSPRGTHAAGEPPRGMSRIDYEQLVRDLRARVGVVSLDCMPAHLTATLRDEGRIFTAEAEDRPGALTMIVTIVIDQALAARKADG